MRIKCEKWEFKHELNIFSAKNVSKSYPEARDPVLSTEAVVSSIFLLFQWNENPKNWINQDWIDTTNSHFKRQTWGMDSIWDLQSGKGSTG